MTIWKFDLSFSLYIGFGQESGPLERRFLLNDSFSGRDRHCLRLKPGRTPSSASNEAEQGGGDSNTNHPRGLDDHPPIERSGLEFYGRGLMP